MPEPTNPRSTPAPVDREIPVPSAWYVGAHGDPIAQFDDPPIMLRLHVDGTATWHRPGSQADLDALTEDGQAMERDEGIEY